jgi:hypothetical protein
MRVTDAVFAVPGVLLGIGFAASFGAAATTGETWRSTTRPGHWVDGSRPVALEQVDVENELYDAAEVNRLRRRRWRASDLGDIRSGLGAGLQEPIDLDATS